MSETGAQALGPALETTRRYRAAVEAGDIEAFLSTLAPDVVLHSPFTPRVQFRGHEPMRTLMQAVFASIEDIRYFEDVGDSTTRALFYRAHAGRQEVEEATLVRLNAEALVTEITLWLRPLPGLTAVMARLGPALAREHGRGRAAAVTALTVPLAAATRAGEALAASLVPRRFLAGD
jgi:SnoaL-like domain